MESSKNIIFENDSLDSKKSIKVLFFKYLFYWKFFIVSLVIFIIASFLFIRYTNKIYESDAKIKIVDKNRNKFDLPNASTFLMQSQINLENEIEVLKSFPIIEQVIKNKKIHTHVYGIGEILSSHQINYPFEIYSKFNLDTLTNSIRYKIEYSEEKRIEITDLQNNQKYASKLKNFNNKNIPFKVLNFDAEGYYQNNYLGYYVTFHPFMDLYRDLKKNLKITNVGINSDVIQLNFRSRNKSFSNLFLNELIKVFNADEIKDRQLVHKRTIDFVNDRFIYLSLELDSIEIEKQYYKAKNELVDIGKNAELSILATSKYEEKIFSTENQIAITKLLLSTLSSSDDELLPSNIGIENAIINTLISDYNLNILERKKIVYSAGESNPTLKQYSAITRDIKQNIFKSIDNYLSQLNKVKEELITQNTYYSDQISFLPEKEKILRSIERNQQIKEALYLFLLEKREEAELNYSVTEPNIKVVEYAIANDDHIYPSYFLTYLIFIFLGIAFPFLVLTVLFFTNNKIYTKKQLEELNITFPVMGEIPQILDNKTIGSNEERTVLAESFRMLSSNLKYFLPVDSKKGSVILISSSIKGEGKTFNSINLALGLSSMNKKTLIIGSDLRNPQVHKYIDDVKNRKGLSNYLFDNKFDWQNSIIRFNDKLECDVLLSGNIPPNPSQLLTNGNFEKLIEEAKLLYDHIIIDTPPVLLVSDTQNLFHLGDAIIFVVRCDYTSTVALDALNDYLSEKKINNIGLVLNDIGSTKANNIDDIIKEVATTRTTERGGRADDKRAETAMEDRKKQGYF